MSIKRKHKRRIGKANPIIYGLAYSFLKDRYIRKYGISFDKSTAENIKGPAIIVATHTSDVDHILSALTLFPLRPTYVVSEHFMHNPSTAGLLKMMHVITKKMFTPDVSTIINLMRAKAEKAVIVIFPEGRLSSYGRTLPVTDGTAELIKKLGIDLYAWRAEGAYLTFPKWRNKGADRPGKINARLWKLLGADEVAERDVCEIREIVEDAIYSDDELAMAGVEYKSDKIAEGAEKILFKCPRCLEEWKIGTKGNRIMCECGLEATLDSRYRLSGAPFERINEWFEWQQASIDTDAEALSTRARLGCCKADGFMDADAGEGSVYLDKNEFRLFGTLHGEKIEFSTSPERIVAFPVTPGDHFDVYHSGQLIYVYPEPDPKSAIKWVCYLDALMEKKRAEASLAKTK